MKATDGKMCSLKRNEVRAVLDRLHKAARMDFIRFVKLGPGIAMALLRGRSYTEAVSPAAMKDCCIPVSRQQGEFLYLTARAIGAKRIVEFGTSFGVSTIYLAAAVRDNRGDIVIGSEIDPSKHQRAVANIEEAGLGQVTEVRLGDALETLAEVPDPVDMVLLDGWKDLYLPVLKIIEPRLRQGAVVLADNIFTFKKALRPYVDYVQAGDNGFESTTLSIADGFEYSVRVA